MEAIINFIKEALAGKKLSAEWIVTLSIAIAGLVWAGTLAYQEYNNMIDNVATLQSQAHEKTDAYDDSKLSDRVTINSEATIALTERIKSLESKILSLEKDIDKAEDNFNNRNGNPLAL